MPQHFAARERPDGSPRSEVSHPSADELATLLAYEDTAQPGGPILTLGAIDRISVYAKANLHWAAPLADAARTLAANQGEREVTPELVRGALFELWSPEQSQPSDIFASNPAGSMSNPDAATMTPRGMSDVPLGSPYSADAGVMPVSPSAADPASSVKLPLGSAAEARTSAADVPDDLHPAPESALDRTRRGCTAAHHRHRRLRSEKRARPYRPTTLGPRTDRVPVADSTTARPTRR